MSIYFNKYQPILELKRRLADGEEEDLEEKDTDTEEGQDDQGTEYNMTDDTPDDPFEGDGGEDDTDNEDDGGEDDTDNVEGDDTPDDPQQPDDTNDNTETDDVANDYSMTDDEEGVDGEEDNTDDIPADDNSDTTTDFTQDEIKQMEQELFKSIPADQMKIKKLELQKQYLEVYETVNNIIERTNKIERSTENVNILKFVLNKLIEFKGLIKDYMYKTFDTKSYIENNINYQEYLVTLNTINKILKEMEEKDNK